MNNNLINRSDAINILLKQPQLTRSVIRRVLLQMPAGDVKGDLISREELLGYLFCKQDEQLDIALEIADFPAVDAVPMDVFEQILWERDTAMQQLKDHGIPIPFGEFGE